MEIKHVYLYETGNPFNGIEVQDRFDSEFMPRARDVTGNEFGNQLVFLSTRFLMPVLGRLTVLPQSHFQVFFRSS